MRDLSFPGYDFLLLLKTGAKIQNKGVKKGKKNAIWKKGGLEGSAVTSSLMVEGDIEMHAIKA